MHSARRFPGRREGALFVLGREHRRRDATVSAVNPAVGPGFHADSSALLQAHKSEVRGIDAPSWDVMLGKQQPSMLQANMASFATGSNAGHFIFVDQPQAIVTTLGRVLAE